MDIKTMSFTINLSRGKSSQAPTWIYHFQGGIKGKERFRSQGRKKQEEYKRKAIGNGGGRGESLGRLDQNLELPIPNGNLSLPLNINTVGDYIWQALQETRQSKQCFLRTKESIPGNPLDMLTQLESIHFSNKYLEICSLLSTVRSAEDSTVNTQCASEIFFLKVVNQFKNLISRLSPMGKKQKKQIHTCTCFSYNFKGVVENQSQLMYPDDTHSNPPIPLPSAHAVISHVAAFCSFAFKLNLGSVLDRSPLTRTEYKRRFKNAGQDGR